MDRKTRKRVERVKDAATDAARTVDPRRIDTESPVVQGVAFGIAAGLLVGGATWAIQQRRS